MSQLKKVRYTSKTHTTGGRDGGASHSDDGRLDVKFSTPGTPGTGTNPEQMFAAGWSDCYVRQGCPSMRSPTSTSSMPRSAPLRPTTFLPARSKPMATSPKVSSSCPRSNGVATVRHPKSGPH